MPIGFGPRNTNNRVLPNNVRAVDVAKASIVQASHLQRLKQHAAIAVQGFDVCVYHKLTSGLKCHCQSKLTNVPESVLYPDGKAPPGLINSLLTGGQEFGISNYGAKKLGDPPAPVAPTPPSDDSILFRIGHDDTTDDLYGDEPLPGAAGTMFDTYSNDMEENATTYVTSGVGANGVVQDSEFETLIDDAMAVDGGYGITDVACPVCMGTGYVGSYSLLNGWRKVLNFQHVPSDSPNANVYLEELVPPINIPRGGAYGFTLSLPYGGVSVDALRLWNGTAQLTTATISVDGAELTQPSDLLVYCDGQSHTITVTAPAEGVDENGFNFTHLELQVNQSEESAYVDFPKLVRGNLRSELDNSQDVSVVVSPIVPMLRPDDFLGDSIHRKIYQVTSVTLSADNRLTVQGWEADCRVVTVQELQNLLPRRLRTPLRSTYTPSLPRDNGSGHRRV